MTEELYNKIDKFCNETDWSKYLTYEHALEEFIKEIVEEETKELKEENKVLAQNLEDTEILNKTYEKRFDDLEKENAELKKKNLDTQDAVTMQMYTNKANEWHYVKDELPELYKDVLVVFSQGNCDVKRLTNHNEWVGRGSWCSLTDVIAWKEIVLPELKESE